LAIGGASLADIPLDGPAFISNGDRAGAVCDPIGNAPDPVSNVGFIGRH
jgi:hypothetical protein